jgi:hypothetical protein
MQFNSFHADAEATTFDALETVDVPAGVLQQSLREPQFQQRSMTTKGSPCPFGAVLGLSNVVEDHLGTF